MYKRPSFIPVDLSETTFGGPDELTVEAMYHQGVETMIDWHARELTRRKLSTTERLQHSTNSMAAARFSHAECAGMLAICLDKLAMLKRS